METRSGRTRRTGRAQVAGAALIAAGVLAWAPYAALALAGGEPPLALFLAVHLAGVLGGAALRARGGRGARDRLGLVGRVVLAVGVLAWAPYVALELALDAPVPVVPFLAVHVPCVLLGGGLMTAALLRRRRR